MRRQSLLRLFNLYFSTSRVRAVNGISSTAIRMQSNLALQPATNMTTNNKPQPSFYKRDLPETCVDFGSREGKKIFYSAMAGNGLKSFFALIQQFTTQIEPAFCGLSTLVLVLNALAVDPHQNWKGPWRWYEERMLNCCVDLEDVKSNGITLRDFRCLAHCQGLSVQLTLCDDQSTLEDFRAAVHKACVSFDQDSMPEDEIAGAAEEPLDVLVISYSRKVLSQTGSGHFSPIAAYDAESDSVLILDTARFKYGAHWAKLPLVYEAMKPIDPATGKSRGYALLSPPSQNMDTQMENNTDENAVQPFSLLFRSKLNQNPARRKYKEYLETIPGEITWKQVCTYWVNEETRVDSVWSILEPLRFLPYRDDEEILNLRSLLNELVQSVDPSGTSCCDSSTDESKCMSEKETVFVIYLASLSKDRRRDLVMDFDSKASSIAREQLLNEAGLVATAIACCDQSSF